MSQPFWSGVVRAQGRSAAIDGEPITACPYSRAVERGLWEDAWRDEKRRQEAGGWHAWSLEQFAEHYVETLARRPNGWGQHVSPIFGQSHHVMRAAMDRFGSRAVTAAFDAAVKNHRAG